MHLVRHPLLWVLIALVVVFGFFFVLAPLLSLVIHLALLAVIIWIAWALLRFHRAYRGNSQDR